MVADGTIDAITRVVDLEKDNTWLRSGRAMLSMLALVSGPCCCLIIVGMVPRSEGF